MMDSGISPELYAFITELENQGFQNAKVCVNRIKTERFKTRFQEKVFHKYGEEISYFVEAMWGKEFCCTYFKLTENRDNIIRRMKDSIGTLEVFDAPAMIPHSEDMRKMTWLQFSEAAVTGWLREAERQALSCEKIAFVDFCELEQRVDETILIDGQHHTLSDDTGRIVFSVRAVAGDKEEIAAFYDTRLLNHENEVMRCQIRESALKAAKFACLSLHAEQAVSGNYPIVLSGAVMAELLEAYLPVFYADNIQYGRSLLAGKQGHRIAVPGVFLEENPFFAGNASGRRMDDEGTPVSRKYLICDGIMGQALYNNKTAALDKCQSTGNGFKTDITDNIGIHATTVIMYPAGCPVFAGEQEEMRSSGHPMEELLAAADGGIFVTQVEGVFAGTDIDSGDFSLLASGNRIQNGQAGQAVNQFTISGNIYDLWKNMELMGQELDSYLSGNTSVFSPGVKIRELAVSGL